MFSPELLQVLAPVCAALFVGGAAYLVWSYFQNPDAGVQQRLKSLGKGAQQNALQPAGESNAASFETATSPPSQRRTPVSPGWPPDVA